MATVEDKIVRAFKLVSVIGNNEDADVQDIDDAFEQVNGIIEDWNINKLMSYSINKESFPLVSNKEQYTIGPSGDYATTRPLDLNTIWVTDTNDISYPVHMIQSDEYDYIRQKQIQSAWPIYAFYNPTYPNGELFVYPKPTAGYTLNYSSWAGFDYFNDKGDTVALPQGFNELLVYQLAVEICPYFSLPVPMQVEKKYNKLRHKLKAIASRTWKPTSNTTTPSNSGRSNAYRTFIPEVTG
jgi:hypothetical protein